MARRVSDTADLPVENKPTVPALSKAGYQGPVLRQTYHGRRRIEGGER
jgi:hypothetical protein